MATVILVIHLMIAAALVGVVLMQKSEGGALGIGGGGAGGLLSGRGTANLLSRTTAALAAAFFLTSLSLTLMAQHATAPRSVLDQAAPAGAPADGGSGQAPRGGLLDRLQSKGGPAPETPAAPTGPAVPQNR